MYLQTQLAGAFEVKARELGSGLVAQGLVELAEGDSHGLDALVLGESELLVSLQRDGNHLFASCECEDFEVREEPCSHIWAALVAADLNGRLQGRGRGGDARLELILDLPLTDEDDGDFDDEEATSWPRPYTPPGPRTPPKAAWRQLLDSLPASVNVASKDAEWRAGREIYYVVDVAETLSNQALSISVEVRDLKQDGERGKLKSERIPRQALASIPDERDRKFLVALAGATSNAGYAWQAVEFFPGKYHLRNSVWKILVPKLCATGRCLVRHQGVMSKADPPQLSWDPGPVWQFHVAMERKRDAYALHGMLIRGDERIDLSAAAVVLADGLFIAGNQASEFEHGNSFAWISALRSGKHVSVPVSESQEFLSELLRTGRTPPMQLPEELRFEVVTATPHPGAKFSQPWKTYGGGSERVSVALWFDYDGTAVSAESPSAGFYDPERRRLVQRDLQAEVAASKRLEGLGVRVTSYISTGARDVPATKLPAIIAALAREGWHVEAEGKSYRRAGSIQAELTSGIDWFDLNIALDFGPVKLRTPELLKALERGETMVRLPDGSFGVVPEELLARYGTLMRLGKAEGGGLRFKRTQAGLLDVFLAGREEVRTDEMFAHARQQLRQFEGLRAAPQPDGFVGTLREYQCEGVAWLEFLDRLGLGGCLADDMGVGKTPQVLAWLETRRVLGEQAPANGAARPGPSLVVVPRSLIYNWKQEAARFTPRLRVLDHSGPGREKTELSFAGYDLVLMTYGTVRRDAVALRDVRFDYVILDEAQAIKNANSESAKAARLLKANRRLAVTGTPIENHLGELWSLFEFLNPGMLGASKVLKANGGALRNPDEETRRLLSHAVRPLILRRTKQQVARELPDRLEQTIYCELDGQQRQLYEELRDHYRNTLLGRIAAEGMERSRFQVLEALLRLRQAACHPGLIDKQRRGESSAKIETLDAQLAEVMDEGHKALVFSQFTQLLGIVRERLDQRKVNYEYLDGQTQNRQERVERFQNDPACKLFLVSLKAGGVGLNLTAADYVFLLDPWWNPAVEAQAIDRAHRIGQTRSVFAYRLIARETVEEKVLDLQKSKRELADAIINGDNRLTGDLSREDLELLLS
ncbi:MAG: DEAD/DEAH box helicase [Bryobacteraceae bacterium]